MTSYFGGGGTGGRLRLLQSLVGGAIDQTQLGVDPGTGVLLSRRRGLGVVHPESPFADIGAAELDDQLTAGHPDAVPAGRQGQTGTGYLERRLLLAGVVVPLDGRVALVQLLADLRQVLGTRKLHLEAARLQSLYRV